MSQFGRPDGDVAVGLWSPYPSTPTTLSDKIDEVTPNGDTDYIGSSNDEDECEVSVGSVDDPGVGTGHKIRCYAKCPLGSAAKENMWIALVENGNIRGQSAIAEVSRTSYALIEYILSEAEANAIGNYANLRLRFHITRVNGGEPIQITQAEFECPDAVVEYVYGGDVPVSILPNESKALLSKSYAGSIPVVALPSHASIGTMVYSGSIPVSALPSYASIGAMVYGGDVPVSALPSYASILDVFYNGAVSLLALPDTPKALLEKGYGGGISLSLISNVPRAFLEKFYAGDVPLVIGSDVPNAQLEKTYQGDVSMSFLLGAIIPKVGKIIVGFIKAIGVTFFPFDFPLYFRVVPREKTIEVVPRKRIFWLVAKDRFFDVVARVRTQSVKVRERIFKVLVRRKK